MGNAAQFSIEIDQELELALDKLRLVVRKLALDGLKGVVLKTPVDTGRARGNWFVQIGGAGTDITDDVDENGGATIARGSSVIDSYATQKGFPSISIYNNLPYINMLEFGGYPPGPKTIGGYSIQAPAGMVGVTVAELQAQL